MSDEKRSYEISLCDVLRTKCVGIRDVYGYVSNEFGDPCFKLTRIALNTGQTIDVEGEHDMPYLCGDDDLFDFPEESEP
jgi:hypothetical protein